MKTFKKTLRDIAKYPSAVAGMLIIAMLVGISIYTVITIPYSEAIRLWRGGEEVWYRNPRFAPPAWTNYFTANKLTESFAIKSSSDHPDVTREDTVAEGIKRSKIVYTIEYPYDDFPQEMMLYFLADYDEKQPFVSAMMITPDGREIRVGDFAVGSRHNYRFSQDERLTRRLKGVRAEQGLFMDPEIETITPLKGTYQLVLDIIFFEPDADVEVEFVFHGKVYGWAGTDHLRRDLMLPLLWGIPIALAFGLVGSIFTSVLTMVISAIGTWFGGWVDALIQRITEVNLVLPFLSILIMVGTFYDRSIWTILGVTIALSIFTGAIKTYRAIFLQVKESTYIEAARAYGANDIRIIFVYLIPRMIPLLIPGLVLAVPAFVFLEASLAVLGLGDPVLPTWGKVINDAQVNGAQYKGMYYWILEPAILLMITGLGFAMLGFALDRIFNPRLRGL